MLVNKTNKVIGKPLVNYGDVVYRNDEIDFDLDDIVDNGSSTNIDDFTDDNSDEDSDNEENNQNDTQNNSENSDESNDEQDDNNQESSEEETDEEFAARLLETYKGEGFDKDGNIIDKDGNIIKPVDEIDEYKVNEPIPLVDEIKTALGYELKDEEGNPIVYEDTVEGMTSLVEDSADLIANKKIETFISEFPEVKSLYNHLATGGQLEDFISTEKDWSNIELSNDNKEQLKNVIKEDFKNKGMDDKVVENILTTLEDAGQLLDTAKTSKQSLIDNKIKIEEQKELQLQQQRQEQQKKIVDYWNNAKEVINNGQLKNISIPQSDRDAFFQYVSKAVDTNGNSQDSLDRQKEDIDTTLLMSYYRFKGYDLSKLVKSMVAQEKVKTLRERRSTENIKTQRPIIKGKMKSADTVDIDINSIGL